MRVIRKPHKPKGFGLCKKEKCHIYSLNAIKIIDMKHFIYLPTNVLLKCLGKKCFVGIWHKSAFKNIFNANVEGVIMKTGHCQYFSFILRYRHYHVYEVLIVFVNFKLTKKIFNYLKLIIIFIFMTPMTKLVCHCVTNV